MEIEEMSRKKAEQRTKRMKKTVCISAFVLILLVVVLVVNFGRKDNLETAKVGKTVWFGTYEQDCDASNGKEKIEWIVLAKEEDRILLLSKYALDCKTYHTTFEDVTWEECTLRRWLNGDFIDAAFSDEERKKIATLIVSVEENSYYDGNPGNATLDKIFLLSISEANQYFSSDIPRQCKATKYAKTQGIYENEVTGYTWWWLRSPGYLLGYAPCVRSVGSVDEYGHKVDTNNNAVRPALWVKLES